MSESTGGIRRGNPTRNPDPRDCLADPYAARYLLVCGREVRRDALRVRGLPNPVSASQRLDAGRSIRRHLADMTEQCQALAAVLRDLDEAAAELEKLLEREEASSQA